jgi:hypothetical protein
MGKLTQCSPWAHHRLAKDTDDVGHQIVLITRLDSYGA